jgi:hypothetical protein
MCDEKRKEDLGKEDREGFKAFEAALASLVPRADRLDRDRLMFLAGQESGAVSGAGQAERGPTNVRGIPDGGTALRLSHPTSTTRTRWAWPAAFAGMTTVAAVLGILLAIRPAVPSVGTGQGTDIVRVKSGMSRDAVPRSPVIALDSADAEASLDKERQPPSPLVAIVQSIVSANQGEAGTRASSPPLPSAPSYAELRDRLIRQGLDSWQVAKSSVAVVPRARPEPTTNRELLKSYLPELQ